MIRFLSQMANIVCNICKRRYRAGDHSPADAQADGSRDEQAGDGRCHGARVPARRDEDGISAACGGAIAGVGEMNYEYQDRVDDFMIRCFGYEIKNDRVERVFRFLEEALELAQAAGATPVNVAELLTYVYGRPPGELRQEVGGVMVCLAALCSANGCDLVECANEEVRRCERNIDKIKAKHAAKPAGVRSARPGLASNG